MIIHTILSSNISKVRSIIKFKANSSCWLVQYSAEEGGGDKECLIGKKWDSREDGGSTSADRQVARFVYSLQNKSMDKRKNRKMFSKAWLETVFFQIYNFVACFLRSLDDTCNVQRFMEKYNNIVAVLVAEYLDLTYQPNAQPCRGHP